MKVREPVKGSTKVRGRETMGVTMVVRKHGEFAMKGDDDVTALGECEDDGSRMEKFVDTGACEVLAWRCIGHVAGASNLRWLTASHPADRSVLLEEFRRSH